MWSLVFFFGNSKYSIPVTPINPSICIYNSPTTNPYTVGLEGECWSESVALCRKESLSISVCPWNLESRIKQRKRLQCLERRYYVSCAMIQCVDRHHHSLTFCNSPTSLLPPYLAALAMPPVPIHETSVHKRGTGTLTQSQLIEWKHLKRPHLNGISDRPATPQHCQFYNGFSVGGWILVFVRLNSCAFIFSWICLSYQMATMLLTSVIALHFFELHRGLTTERFMGQSVSKHPHMLKKYARKSMSRSLYIDR